MGGPDAPPVLPIPEDISLPEDPSNGTFEIVACPVGAGERGRASGANPSVTLSQIVLGMYAILVQNPKAVAPTHQCSFSVTGERPSDLLVHLGDNIVCAFDCHNFVGGTVEIKEVVIDTDSDSCSAVVTIFGAPFDQVQHGSGRVIRGVCRHNLIFRPLESGEWEAELTLDV